MSERRRSILDAAQRLFLDKGYAGTSIGDIRAASGASTGSIYHAFATKEGIAIALVQRSISAWAAEAKQGQGGRSFEEELRHTIGGLLRWAGAAPDAFRIMDELRSVAARGGEVPQLAAVLNEARTEGAGIFEAEAADGRIRALPLEVAQALVLGPPYEYLRSMKGRLPPQDVDGLITIFVEAALRSLAP